MGMVHSQIHAAAQQEEGTPLKKWLDEIGESLTGRDGFRRISFGDKGSSDQDETPFSVGLFHPTYIISVTQIRFAGQMFFQVNDSTLLLHCIYRNVQLKSKGVLTTQIFAETHPAVVAEQMGIGATTTEKFSDKNSYGAVSMFFSTSKSKCSFVKVDLESFGHIISGMKRTTPWYENWHSKLIGYDGEINSKKRISIVVTNRLSRAQVDLLTCHVFYVVKLYIGGLQELIAIQTLLTELVVTECQTIAFRIQKWSPSPYFDSSVTTS
ncbi:hypothetical protein FRX31_014681 [Thalictrum thalictroides]|uniref:Uncharacterized protein n=1 Tax=Thalictrum thalictroides TaxID=46969 RepID=A0A7J6WI11_THATH|nr:hypothetical protein FRX31_014681 [Thalictrum thalictroides]